MHQNIKVNIANSLQKAAKILLSLLCHCLLPVLNMLQGTQHGTCINDINAVSSINSYQDFLDFWQFLTL